MKMILLTAPVGKWKVGIKKPQDLQVLHGFKICVNLCLSVAKTSVSSASSVVKLL